jgi:adenine-specific DNA-methyltransferase
VYAKLKEIWQPNLLARSEEMNARYRNLDNDPRGDWKPTDASAQAGHGTPSQFYELFAPNGRTFHPPTGRCWVYTKERMQEMIADNRVWFGSDGNSAPAIKRFLTEVKQGVACQTIWKYEDVGHNQEGKKEIKALFPEAAPFDTPKPTRLIERILQLSTASDENHIILDFFSGSATTAHAVMQLNAEDGGNRRFIMVQLPEITDEKSEAHKAGYKNICEIGKERIRRAGAKLKEMLESKGDTIKHLAKHIKNAPTKIYSDEESCTVFAVPMIPPMWRKADNSAENKQIADDLDIGFRVLKLDTSNLYAWDGTPIGDGNLQTLWDRFTAREKTIKRDRSDMDMVFEVMLKMGIHLDYVVSEITVGSKKCYSIGERPFETSHDCMILVCLDFGITPKDITAFCELAPAKIIAAEEAFEDSTTMSNAHYILRDRDIEMKLL